MTVAFPANVPDDLDEECRRNYEHNLSHVRRDLRVGTWMRFTRYRTQGASWFKLHRWPDSTGVDQRIADAMEPIGHGSAARLLPHETPIRIVSVDFDGFGNAWCYVVAGDQLGFVPGGSLVSLAERERQGPLHG